MDHIQQLCKSFLENSCHTLNFLQSGREGMTLDSLQPILSTLVRQRVSPSQILMLLSVRPKGGLPMSDLASSCHVSGANCTGLCDVLERQGMIARRHDTGDRRKVFVEITPRGAKALKELSEELAPI